MVSPMFSVFLIPFLIAMFLAINMGGSGTSPAFAAAYGSQAVKKSLVPTLFGTFVVLGALIAGRRVTLTVGRGILPDDAMGLILTAIVLLSVSLSLLVANLLRIPQSTSQATVFALVGPAVYFGNLQTHKLVFEIMPFWFVLPVASFLITLISHKVIGRRMGHAQFVLPQKVVTRFSKTIVVLASCYVAFAIGSNNVANAAGPIVSMVFNELRIGPDDNGSSLIVVLAMLIVAPCFAIGSSLLGGRVAQATGKSITAIGSSDAILISITTATLLLFASVFKGIPMSLVQLNTGSIIAVGISRVGWKEGLARPAIKRVLFVWVIAPLI
ncbi:MAG TPA: inorganic phosphate transporter, partial [Candidatus Hydrogenedentes bacterium]|nr:inorganic phosphate transporter [Candidatus Hydrogenedentota bacterium]